MDLQAKYPALACAIGLMQMDNGYCDEGGVVQALTRMEMEAFTEDADRREVTPAQITAAEAWCAAALPAELDAACAGEERAIDVAGTAHCIGMEAEAFVPAGVHRVLNYLFDNM